MRITSSKKRLLLLICLKSLVFIVGILTLIGFMVISLKLVDPTAEAVFPQKLPDSNIISISVNDPLFTNTNTNTITHTHASFCASVDEMGLLFRPDFASSKESLRVRRLIHLHFLQNGASRIRQLPPEQFCRHGFVIAKASEAGFGNEMYKILTGAALSIMLNRSLIIGQTRHIGSL